MYTRGWLRCAFDVSRQSYRGYDGWQPGQLCRDGHCRPWLVYADARTKSCFICAGYAGDHERDDFERSRRDRLLLSDYSDELSHELWSFGSSNVAVGEYKQRIAFRDDSSEFRNIDGDFVRHQRRWYRECHSDDNGRSRTASDHERDDGERGRRDRLLLSDYSDKLSHELWGYGSSDVAVGEHKQRVDFRDSDEFRNIDGDSVRHQRRRYRECHSDDNGRSSIAGHHERSDVKWNSGNSVLLSDCSDKLTNEFWSKRFAGGAVGERKQRIDFRNSDKCRNATVTLTATNSSGSGHATLTLTIGTVVLISSAQVVATAASASASTLSLSFPQNTAAGDLILVAFDYDLNSTPSSVADSQGNVFTPIGSQLTSPAGARSRVYYAKSIKGGADMVTVNLSGNSAWIELYISEYTGVDTVNPIDAQAGASGAAGAVSSGPATTTATGDVIYGYCLGDSMCRAGAGFTGRSTFHGNLIEDITAGNPGGYAATGTANHGWSMQMLALKP